MKKRIVVLYATYGSGHKAIANYIKSYYEQNDPDYEILTIDLLDYALPILGKASKVVNEFLMLRMPSIWNAIYHSGNYNISGKISLKISMNLFRNKYLKELITNFNPDVAICTHFFGIELIKRYARENIINPQLINIITDYESHALWINHPRPNDYYIVGSRSEILPLEKRGVDRKKIKVYGIPINPVIDPEFNADKAKEKYKFYNGNLTCTFFGGGGNGSMASLPFIKRLIKANLDLNIIFISGKNEKCRHRVEKIAKKYHAKNIRIIGYANNVPELLQMSDFVVTKPGGVQTTECMYFKKPMILFNSSGGQENANYRYIEEMGYGKMFRTSFFFSAYIRSITYNPSVIYDKVKNFNSNNAEKSMDSLYRLINEILNKKKD